MNEKLKFSAFAAALIIAVMLSGAPPLFAFVAFVGLPIAMMITALASLEPTHRSTSPPIKH